MLRNAAIVSVLAALLSIPLASHALDQEQLQREPTTSEVVADALLARPLGLVASAIGAVTFVVSLPFTIPSNTVDKAGKILVLQPMEYTFKRPIGQFDSCLALPESCKN